MVNSKHVQELHSDHMADYSIASVSECNAISNYMVGHKHKTQLHKSSDKSVSFFLLHLQK